MRDVIKIVLVVVLGHICGILWGFATGTLAALYSFSFTGGLVLMIFGDILIVIPVARYMLRCKM